MQSWISKILQHLAIFFCVFSFCSWTFSTPTRRKFTLIQIAVVCSYTFYRGYVLSLSLEKLDQPNSTRYRYFFFIQLFVSGGTLLLFSRAVWKRKDIFRAVNYECRVLRSNLPVNDDHRVKRKCITCFKLMLAILHISVVLYHIIVYDIVLVVDFVLKEDFTWLVAFNVLCKLLSRPVRCWSTVVLYSFTYGRVVELEASEAVHDQIYAERGCAVAEQGLETALPLVTGGVENCAKVSIVYNENSLYYTDFKERNFDQRIRQHSRDFLKVKSFSCVMHELFFAPSSFLILKALLFFPIVLVFHNFRMQAVGKLTITLQWVHVMLVPTITNIGLCYRNKYLWAKAKNEVFRFGGRKRRQGLLKFVSLAKTQFSGVFWILFEFDSELLMCIVDSLVLITTGLFTKGN